MALGWYGTHMLSLTLCDRKLEVLAIYDRMRAANRHKLVPIPICEIPEELRS